jgi:uncharacterized membrane protein
MLVAALDFLTLLIAALVVGAMFGVSLIFNPAGLDPATYVMQQQLGIRTLNTAMPVLGGTMLLLTLAAAILAREQRTRLILLASAALCFLAAGLITRFLNQPINAIMMSWTPDAPPAEWTALRDAWWRWHSWRLAAGIGGLCLVIVAALQHEPSC